MKKTALLLWSGGVDSTYILMEFIRTGMVGEVAFDFQNVIETDFQSVSGNYQNAMARIAIKREIEKLYGDISNIVKFKSERFDLSQFSMGNKLMQPLIWLFVAIYAAQESDTLVFGYVRDDQFWHVRSSFDLSLLHAKDVIGKELNTFYPLEWTRKSDVISSMNLIHQSVYKLCWYCESYNLFPCGKCESCNAHDSHEQSWSLSSLDDIMVISKDSDDSQSESGVMFIPKSS